MPHVTIELSPACAADPQALCDRVFDALAAHPATGDAGNLKIRAYVPVAERIGSGAPFAHAMLGLIAGRSEAQSADMARCVLEALAAALPDRAAITVDTYDFSPALARRAPRL